MEKICCIISAGDVNTSVLKEKKNEYSYFIAADLGFEKALLADITPSLLVGDFDSIKHIPENVNKITLPIEKDITDCVAAFNEGVKLGFKSFVLLLIFFIL